MRISLMINMIHITITYHICHGLSRTVYHIEYLNMDISNYTYIYKNKTKTLTTMAPKQTVTPQSNNTLVEEWNATKNNIYPKLKTDMLQVASTNVTEINKLGKREETERWMKQNHISINAVQETMTGPIFV